MLEIIVLALLLVHLSFTIREPYQNDEKQVKNNVIKIILVGIIMLLEVILIVEHILTKNVWIFNLIVLLTQAMNLVFPITFLYSYKREKELEKRLEQIDDCSQDSLDYIVKYMYDCKTYKEKQKVLERLIALTEKEMKKSSITQNESDSLTIDKEDNIKISMG